MLSQFHQKLQEHGLDLHPSSLDTLQINITKLCNQACVHCHVDSSPRRREMMSDAVVEKVIEWMTQANSPFACLDITGGAPELHPRFCEVVERVRQANKRVIVRHNFTVQLDPHPITNESLDYLPEFFAKQGVELICSLPCYQEDNTDRQRGQGVFNKSMTAMNRLNEQGFGHDGSGLILNLIYNPVGTHLPPDQGGLQKKYKEVLSQEYDLHFNQLFAMTNMPIHRFKVQLRREGSYDAYLELLLNSFNRQAAEGVMCRSMLSVSYDGKIYDCDFNQMLGMEVDNSVKGRDIFSLDPSELLRRPIVFAEHCLGCTAGAGSSCGGQVPV